MLARTMNPMHEMKGDMSAVISPRFCHQYPVHLTVVRNPIAVTDSGKYLITDEKAHHLLGVKETLWSIHGRHVITDTETNPIATCKKKLFSGLKKWQVFQGSSSNLLFTAKNCSPIHSKIEVEVYLAGNKKQDYFWDFKVGGCWKERSFVVYDRDFKPIARMEKKSRGTSILGKETFHLTVSSKVDYAFIVTLVVLLCEAKEDKEN
ncbi:protein LURP-one-related 10-like [Andrographis paniculata]|uniref:protein LURP-one-related 10-like n=1 Tax=Andrographis paniculata TaxID=175694 RepID=UPI0021E8F87A|nr:protein LURP-one-related 10-like [Andrographis paniculata]